MNLIFKIPLSAALTAATFVGVSAAHDWYAGGSVAWQQQADSSNSGQFTSDFAAGTDGTNAPSTVPAGTSLGWTTEFDDSYAVNGEVGARFNNGLRGALEVSFSESDVKTHRGVAVGGANVDAADVALLTGSAVATGATVGATVADGRGQVQNLSAFANAYYDFNRGGIVEPYVGAGIGATRTEVEYSPSGVGITKEDDTRLAYQLKAGATYRLNDRWEAFGEYTYRAAEDMEVALDLVPGNLEIENEQQMLGVGLRYRFGG